MELGHLVLKRFLLLALLLDRAVSGPASVRPGKGTPLLFRRGQPLKSSHEVGVDADMQRQINAREKRTIVISCGSCCMHALTDCVLTITVPRPSPCLLLNCSMEPTHAYWTQAGSY